jgi:hypothetical protein
MCLYYDGGVGLVRPDGCTLHFDVKLCPRERGVGESACRELAAAPPLLVRR